MKIAHRSESLEDLTYTIYHDMMTAMDALDAFGINVAKVQGSNSYIDNEGSTHRLIQISDEIGEDDLKVIDPILLAKLDGKPLDEMQKAMLQELGL